mmetsp:Transcript_68330/g.127538  ORF Transcript_68330/g.127538 Transcript_68330/m.127538 type:complete len:428 (+) Transcript_68330:83-1366(+)
MLSVLHVAKPANPRSSRRAARQRTRTNPTAVAALGCAILLWLPCLWAGDEDGFEAAPIAFVSSTFLKQALPTLGALLLGLLLYALGQNQEIAIVLIYFGAQTGMNMYMKTVLSKMVVDEEAGLVGMPIGFLMTVIQQLVAFVLFGCFLLLSKFLDFGYQTKKLTTKRELVAILCFSMTFALNIGLNNFSLSLVAISINMIIRACLPLSTALSQILLGSCLKTVKSELSAKEWGFMLCGVGCAGVATYVQSVSGMSMGHSDGLILGVMCAVTSIFSGAFNMVLAGVLGTQMKLNPLDTVCYMALPAAVFLLLPAMLVSHPMGKWPGFPSMTDWEVLLEVIKRNPMALTPVFFSGVLSLVYNTLQYTLVHKLSATHATFAGNFNKAATVALSLLLGLEILPPGHYGRLYLLAVVGNIAAFTAYSMSSKK